MQITPAAIRALYPTFSKLFQTAFDATPKYSDPLVTDVTANGEKIDFGFMDRIPKMRKWLGDRVINNLVSRVQELIAEPYEDTVGVDKFKIQDDNLGVYEAKFRYLGDAAGKLWDQLFKETLQLGVSTVVYDGQFYFDTDHPVNIDDATFGVQSNDLTLALNDANFATARATMRAYKGADGESIGAMPNLLVVPPSLEQTARQIINASIIVDGNAGVSNVWQGAAGLLVVDELENEPTVWYMMHTTSAVKPFVRFIRDGMEFTAKDNPNDDNVFFKHKFVYGVNARGAVGYGPYFYALRSEP